MKRIVKLISVPALIILLPLLALFLYIANGIAEIHEADGNTLKVWWFIPASVRAVELPRLCKAPTYSKNYLECGGICGEVYSINTSTKASYAEIKDAAQTALSDDFEMNVFGLKEPSGTCQDVFVDYIKRY